MSPQTDVGESEGFRVGVRAVDVPFAAVRWHVATLAERQNDRDVKAELKATAWASVRVVRRPVLWV